jgi:hypothetical protein
VKISVKIEPTSETEVHKLVAWYIRTNYPGVFFFSDLSGVRLTPGVAKKVKSLKCDKGIPDLWIIKKVNGYSGLVLELKTEQESPYLKDGSLSKSKHIQEQHQRLQELQKEGFFALFSPGLQFTCAIIDKYLNGEIM